MWAPTEAAAEEIDGLGALRRDVPVCAVVLDLDAPRDPPPLNLLRLPRAVIAVATGADVVLLVPVGLAARTSPATPGCSSLNACRRCTTPWSRASGRTSR